MPGCAAIGCNNRSEKGFIMKCFPRDPILRKIWQDRVARADWEPSNNSFLCQVHFEPEEWFVSETGRLKLKKNAVPSIFTITSTRKSAKKRLKLTNVKNENQCENDCSTESLENDTEHSSIGHLEEKDSDSQDVDPSIQTLVYQANNFRKKMEDKQISHRQYIDITNDLQRENIIIISDDNNMEMEINIKESDTEKQTCVENEKSVSGCIAKKKSTDNQDEDVVIKTEINQVFDDSYDEIEEKLKQICDGQHEENVSNMEKQNSISRNRKRALEKSIAQMSVHKSINYKYSTRNEIGDMLTDDRDNIEIIFGSESGEEFSRVPRYTFYNNSKTNDIDKQNQNIDIDNIANKEIDETCVGYIKKDVLNRRENVHTSNVTTAMKYEWRTGEEVTKSIKRFVQNASFQHTNSTSNRDTSDIDVEDEIKKELNMSDMQYSKDDAILHTTKFMVKVTGDREDVLDIMQDLFRDTKNFTIQEHDNCLQQGNNRSVTSIIIIDDCPIKVNTTNKCNDDVCSTNTNTALRDDQASFVLSVSKNNECPITRLPSPNTSEEKNLNVNSIINNATDHQSITNYTNKSENVKLQEKVKLQEDIIRELTNQIILLKDMEKQLQYKNLTLRAKTRKMEKRMNDSNKSTDSTPSSMNYKQTDMRQRVIYNLSNRMNTLEEINKKLMKTITIECQQKRQLESQIKQRDKRIKELNWKLEKASKYLDRAEKNTNTYKRKMLNMQTFIRRKRLLDSGNTSKFHEIMIDSVKEDYSERVLIMAMEIKKICGINGYKKLLNLGFPLPALSVLQSALNDGISDSNKSDNKIDRANLLETDTNEKHDTQSTNSNADVSTRNHAENAISFGGDINVIENVETVTGTVQDIFEESNDEDDFSTNELRDHFILQLNAVI
ncbi:uncharacterized protein LOC105431639 [Pogonomyrmex barbatus]|uniref:Uncharacterized protein LOC105431639 n=1 Tax=Pogonomyrmex barbatus TaxID=144034 RepID=A0A6I9WQD3_9HYME|nr:uncharacterized protein LOC105431639 [Pogonomyrmex barbatus]